MLSAWIRIFEPNNDTALSFAKRWANVISKAFQSGIYSDTSYTKAYILEFSSKPRGGRERDFIDFYHLNLLKEVLPHDIEDSMLNYAILKPDGIYCVYDKTIITPPKIFKSKETSRYLEAIEIISEYRSAKDRLSFVVDWLEDNKDENGQWDLGAQAKDNILFPLSDSWRKSSDRIKDCTYRIEKIIANFISWKEY